MKILLIRHADPDYSIDSLTKKGWKEAQLLAERMARTKMDAIYVSPLGRAKDTAQVTLDKTNKTATELPWLREFHAPVVSEVTNETRLPWDFIPREWANEPLYYDHRKWFTTNMMAEGKVGDEAERVQQGFDSILLKHGYKRSGNYYKALASNEDTLVFFCHFGVIGVILGHLLGISPMVIWHGMCAAPSSVTTIITEERRKGDVYFRMNSFADTCHLYIENEPPSFAARFCETYERFDQRHD